MSYCYAGRLTSPPFSLLPPPTTAFFHTATAFPPPFTPLKIQRLYLIRPSACRDYNNGNGGSNGGNNGGSNGGAGGNGDNNFFNFDKRKSLLFLLPFTPSFVQAQTNNNGGEIVYEIRGGKRLELVPDYTKDEFVLAKTMWLDSRWGNSFVSNLWIQCKELTMNLLLPEGFPESVTSDYLEYALWRGVQSVAAQISGVLSTQALLYAVGLGKGAIPTAAAVNWVLKDGIGYLSKILLSNYGRHFDVNPKSWRLFADLLENAAYGLEILTPAFPHLFVPIGAVAGAGRSAASLIQAATRSCFYAGFAAQRNFAEVIAKGEAQGMVSKAIGIMLGIALANCTRSSTSLALASFGVITWIHMFCNLKSYQSIQLRTLNPYRASLVFSEYLLSGLVPSVKEVNDEEPLFPAAILNLKAAYETQTEVLSVHAKQTASGIVQRLQLGSKLSDIATSQEDVLALFELYKNEGYILTEHEGRFCIVLKESSSPQDMLKSLFHVNYLYWLENNAGIKSSSVANDCRPGGRLQISLEYVEREFNHVKSDGEVAGWVTDSLIARPLPNRLRLDYAAVSSVAEG
ncbi:hypothetical protein RND71_032191 [Anisodus tanguticus]|uniref:Protein root UVB sensitive 1, chloroplastic n=1 Tax=Anisodus tanguticus TaxID=243964 RepID=A0AAE1V3Z6_9SOLA|nr:hypothetical protein RND71_032191 [Anisodus tanguticus]